MPVAFSSQEVVSSISNPTSLQFGPDGRLYVSQQDGTIQVYAVEQSDGQWSAVLAETIDIVRDIPNHDDNGSLNLSLQDRQVTGLLVTGTAAAAVLYVTSSDPRIATGTDADLDTNSGVLSRLTFDGSDWTKVDLIRGLPRSEENHSPNGMALSADGTKLYLAQGGNTNNGAPSSFFSNTPEYALSAALLEIDLVALNAIADKTFTHAPGITSVYKYDLPTLDDPTVANNGAAGGETAGGMDIGGPFGGNDGMNQAVLPADAPLRIYATGLRNAFDVVLTQDGRLFTVDNGGNEELGSTPVLDAQGRATNEYHSGGIGNLDHLYLLEGGGYYGHPDPTRSNQTGSIHAYTDGLEPYAYATIANAAAAVPGAVAMTPGFVIDPTKFTSEAARLAMEGQFTVAQHSLAAFAASTNGLIEYTAGTFDGEIAGDLITASFDGTIKLIHRAADGVTVTGVTTLATPGGIPLDLTQGPDGTIWVTQIGSGQILVLTPATDIVADDPDIDDDGLLNTVDRFQADAANGLTTLLGAGASYNWDFQFGAGSSSPGPTGLFLGLTGHMTNGQRDFVAPVADGGLDLGNVKIGTAAGGGLVVVEEVSNGTASGTGNTGEYQFQTGISLAPTVQAFNIKWTAINPFPGMAASPTVRQIGGYIGTGDQDNFFKLAAGPNGSGNVLFELESNGVVVASQTMAAAGLLTATSGSSLVFNLAVNRATATVTPSITYSGPSGPVTVTGNAVSLAGTSILDAIEGDFQVQGQASGLAVGLWSSNTGEGSQTTFQAAFDDILITTSGPTPQLIKAVNVGGGQFTSSSGIVYEADAGPTTGGAASEVFSNNVAIAGTTDDGLYMDERYIPGGSYTYEIPVANGTYRVDLNLAEIYGGITGSGQRVFDMSLEGQALAPLQNIDIYGQVGAFSALTISQQVTVNDGSLSIQVGPGSNASGNVENAKLNGFAVFSTGGAPTVPTLSIAAASASKAEGSSGSTAFTFTVSRSGDLGATSAAAWTVTGSGANAASGADFVGATLPTGTVTFAAGEASRTVTVNVAGDTAVEPAEGFTVTLSAPSGATIATATATGSILNDDSAAVPALSIAAVSASQNEGNTGSTAFTFTVSRAGDASGASSASWSVTGSGASAANATDFTGGVLPAGTVSFAAGETTKTVTVNVAGDVAVEQTEGFTVTLSAPAGATIATATASSSILNDDGATPNQLIKAVNVGGGQFTSSSGIVYEADAGPTTGGAASEVFSNNVAIAGTTDDGLYIDERWTPGGSYTYEVAVANGTYRVDLNLAEIYWGITGPGQRVFDMALEGQALAPLQNVDVYGQVGGYTALVISQQVTVNDGSLSIQVGPGSNASGNVENAKLNGFAVFSAGGTPTAPTLSIAATSASKNEGNSGSTAFTFTVNRSGDTSGASSAGWAVTGSSANAASAADFAGAALPSGTVSFAAGETTKTVTVNVAGDTTVEQTEGFTVTLSAPTGATITTATATGSILNDDGVATPSLSIAAASASQNEGNSGSTAFTFTVTRAGDLAAASAATWAVTGSGASAASAADFTGGTLPTGSVSFAAGEATKTVTVNVAGDTAVEQAEGFTVTLSAPTGATITTATATGSILNDDGAVQPELSIAAASASKNEGNSGTTAFTFTVTRSGDTSGASSASWATTGSGANAASAADFTGGTLPTGSVSFAAGETTKTVTVNVAGDTTVEQAEGFTVTLSAPTGATIATAAATGSILNDDAAPAGPVARLDITPDADLNASTFNQPSYELTNTGSVAITSLLIDLHGSLIAGNVFDPFGTFGDTTALDFTPYAAPVSATWSYGPAVVTEGGYKTLQVNFGGGGLAAGQTFGFRLDADPASIQGASPGPNEAGSISGFEHIGAAVTVGLANGGSHTAEVFTQGTAGGGTATLGGSLPAAPLLTISTISGTPLATDLVGDVIKANLPGLNALAGSAGNDILVGVSGVAGQTVRLSVAEIGGAGQDIALGSHEGNTILKNPLFIDVVLGSNGSASVAIALPAETPTSALEAGSVSGRFAITAATVNPSTGAATSLVSSTLVVKDAANSFTSEAAADTFTFREGFVSTDIFAFAATGPSHDLIELDQDLFPGMTVEQFLNSGALSAGAGAGDVDITTSSGTEIRLHDSSGVLTVATLQAHPEDFRFF